MPQHLDPFIYNSQTGLWQNASNPAGSGSPFGLSVGAAGASQVSLEPLVGDTIQVDSGSTAIIASAVQLGSGAATENLPGFVAAVVFNPGAVNEQIGTLSVSPLANVTAHAVLMQAQSADGTLAGSTRIGTIVPGGGGVTWAFSTAVQIFPSGLAVRLAQGYVAAATNPAVAGAVEPWHAFAPGSSWTVPGGGVAKYRLTVQNELQISAWIKAPASAVNGVTITTFPASYRPLSTHGFGCGSDGINATTTGNGFFTVTSAGVLQSTGILAGANCYIEASVPLDA